jgi:aryl-alcohol dehydrogenase-like predicted oxidoreductase
VPISETMAALNYLKAQGKIRAIGVSNFSRSQLEEAGQYGRIESIQPPYSLFWRSVEKEIMPYCIDNNISILAYSPLAQGLLTGKFRNGYQLAAEDHRIKNKLFHGENFQRVQAALTQLEPIANRYSCSLAQLSLAWLIKQPQTNAIAGVRNAAQAVNNAQAMTINLTPEDLKLIDNIGKQVTDFLDDNPVLWDF